MTPFYHAPQGVQQPLFVFSKVCNHCELEKPLEEFYKDPRYTDGYRNVCSGCMQKQRRENRQFVPPPSTYVCSKCQVEKPIDQFYKDKTAKNGYHTACKNCTEEEASAKRGCVHQKFVKGNNHGTSETKWCYGCEQEKPLSAFRKDSTKIDGKCTRCKDCQVARDKVYHEVNKEKRNEQSRQYQANMDWHAYYVKHKLKLLEKNHRRIAMQQTVTTGEVSYEAILERDGLWCYICNQAIDPEGKGGARLTFDHQIPIIPRPGDPQGTHTEDNIHPAHKSCNSRKSNRRLEDLTEWDRRGPNA